MPKSDISHRFFALVYPRIAAAAERAGLDESRKEMLASLRGRVLEVGAGHGVNFAYYPDGVTEVIAVEPEPRLRRRAVQAARRAPVKVRVRAGNAERLPFDDGEFDAAVTSLMLCSVPSQERALREIRRVLKPGGELRFLEHVRSSHPGLAFLQRTLDATVWPLAAGGCHLSRDTEAAIVAAGFQIARVRRYSFLPCVFAAPTAPHIVGRALTPRHA